MRSVKLLTFVVLLVGLDSADAQRWRGRETDYYFSQVQVSGSRSAEQQLEKAKKDLENQEWERCVRLVQGVLDENASGALSTDSGRFLGIRDYCHDFLKTLPPAGFAVYRTIFDPYAKKLFEAGLAHQDPTLLRDVYLRYLYTSYGKPSLLAAVDMLLERGDFKDASNLALLFRESFPDDGEGTTQVLATLVLGLRAAGEIDRLTELKAEIADHATGTKILIGGQPTSLAALVDDALAAARKRAPDLLVTHPPMRLFERPQWSSMIDMQEQRTEALVNLYEFGHGGPRPSQFGWNPVIPVVDEGTVFVSNGVSVRAFGLFSQEEKWTFEGVVESSQARRSLSIEFPLATSGNVVYAALETPVRPEKRIWNFTPEISVPHRQLFALDATQGKVLWQHYRFRSADQAQAEFVQELTINSQPLIFGDDVLVAASRFHTSYHHYLCCFDRLTGRLKWSTFVCTGQMEQNNFGNRVRECIAGSIAEKDGVVYYSTNIGVVAAVDARLGTLRFTVEYEQDPIPRQKHFDTNVHERAPGWANNAPIFIGDEVFVAPMDSPHLLAINRHSGRARVLLTRDEGNRYRYVVGPYRDQIVVAGAGLVFYDAARGQKLEPDYGFSGGSRTSVDHRVGFNGRPAIVGNRLYAPIWMRGGQERLFVWDLDSLKIIEDLTLRGRSTDQRDAASYTGNLVVTDEAFVIASTAAMQRKTWLHCYFDRASVRVRLDESIAAAPDDPRLHFRAGEFALQGTAKDYATALTHFERAWELARTASLDEGIWAERSRDALYRLFLDLAEKPETSRTRLGLSDLDCYERALTAARDASQKVDILFLLLKRSMVVGDVANFARHLGYLVAEYGDLPYDYRNLFRGEVPQLITFKRYDRAGMVATTVAATFSEKQGRFEEAIASYQSLLRTYPEQFVGKTSAWEFAFTRIEALIERLGRDIYRAQDDEAVRLFAEAAKTGKTAPLRRILDVYPNSRSVSQAYVEISRRHLATNNQSAAVATIHEYLWKFGTASGEILLSLAQALEDRGAIDSARQTRRYAAAVAGADEVSGPDGATTVADLIAARGDGLHASREDFYTLPSFAGELTESWTQGTEGGPEDWKLIRPRGSKPAAVAGTFLVHFEQELRCLELGSGRLSWKMTAATPPLESLEWFDGRLTGIVDGDLLCLDPKTGAEYWRESSGSYEVAAARAGQGKVFALLQPRTYGSRFLLQARSILDGSLVFTKTFEGAPYNEIQLSDRWLLVPLETEAACVVLDAFTGRPPAPYTDGFAYEDLRTPSLSADGKIITITEIAGQDRQRIIAVDPESGRQKWTRDIEVGSSIRYHYHDAFTLVYHVKNIRSKQLTIVAVDLLAGKTLLDFELDKDVTPGFGVHMTATDLYMILRETKTRPQRHFLYNLVDFALSTQSVRWRTAQFPNVNVIAAQLHREGAVLTVVERSYAARRATANQISTLYCVDGTTGKVGNQARLDSKSVRYLQNLLLVDEGCLVVADGPVLKVYKP